MKIVKMTEVQKQLVIIGGVAALMLILGVWVLVLPAFARLSSLKSEIAQVEHKKEILEQQKQMNEQVKKLEKGLTSEKKRHLILGQLTNLAKNHGLEIDTVTPDENKEKKSGGFYHDFLIRMKVSGPFAQLLRFLSAVEKLEPHTAVSQMSFEPTNEYQRPGEAGSPAITLVLKTLLLKGADGVTSGTDGGVS